MNGPDHILLHAGVSKHVTTNRRHICNFDHTYTIGSCRKAVAMQGLTHCAAAACAAPSKQRWRQQCSRLRHCRRCRMPSGRCQAAGLSPRWHCMRTLMSVLLDTPAPLQAAHLCKKSLHGGLSVLQPSGRGFHLSGAPRAWACAQACAALLTPAIRSMPPSTNSAVNSSLHRATRKSFAYTLSGVLWI